MPSPSRYLALHDALATKHPDSIRKASALAASTLDPRTATADEAWCLLWDKPLFANTRVRTAERRVAAIADDMIGAWRIWGADPAMFRIRQIRPGVKRDSFEVLGALGQDLVARHSIALHRLYRIQGAAAALRVRAARSAQPIADLWGRPLKDIVPQLQHEFGPGWGPVTVLHALTDLGLAVKPDLHLVATMNMLEPDANYRVGTAANAKGALHINKGVCTLLDAIGHAPTPKNLRYIDKVLMEISRQGLLGYLPHYTT